LGRVRRGPHLAPDVLARPQAQGPEPLLVPGEGVERRLHLPGPRRDPDRSLLDDPEAQVGEALEHTVEDQRGERLRRWVRDAHLVDRGEVLLAAVEVRWDRQAVVEAAGLDE